MEIKKTNRQMPGEAGQPSAQSNGPFYFGRGVGQLPKTNSCTAKLEKKNRTKRVHSLTHKQKVKKKIIAQTQDVKKNQSEEKLPNPAPPPKKNK